MIKSFWVVEKRRELFQQTLRILKVLGKTDYKRAVAVICVGTGLREEKVQEYLTILKNSDSIKIEDGEIEVIQTHTHIHNSQEQQQH